MDAARKGDTDKVITLLESGTMVDERLSIEKSGVSVVGTTALIEAAKNGHTEIELQPKCGCAELLNDCFP